MPDTERLSAGAVILQDLALFNKSAVYFEKIVQPKILAAVRDLIEAWVKKTGWQLGWPDDPDFSIDDVWVAPRDWHIDVEPVFAWFAFVRHNKDSDAYAVADMFGAGETEFGFRFSVEPSKFGGQKRWNAFIKDLRA